MIPPSALSVVQILAACPGVERVRLFGSRARGDHDARSDVDLAVDAPTLSHRDRAQVADDVEEADTLYRIDLVWSQEASSDLLARIAVEGVTLYDHQGTPAAR